MPIGCAAINHQNGSYLGTGMHRTYFAEREHELVDVDFCTKHHHHSSVLSGSGGTGGGQITKGTSLTEAKDEEEEEEKIEVEIINVLFIICNEAHDGMRAALLG